MIIMVVMERQSASVCLYMCVYVCVCVWETAIDGEKRQKRKEEKSCQSGLVISGVEVSPSSPSTLFLHAHMDLQFHNHARIHTYTHTHTHTSHFHSNMDLQRCPQSAVNPPFGCFSLGESLIIISFIYSNQISLFIRAY